MFENFAICLINPKILDKLKEVDNIGILQLNYDKIDMSKFVGEIAGTSIGFGIKEHKFICDEYHYDGLEYCPGGLFDPKIFCNMIESEIEVVNTEYKENIAKCFSKRIKIEECGKIKLKIPYLLSLGEMIAEFCMGINHSTLNQILSAKSYVVIETNEKYKCGQIISEIEYAQSFENGIKAIVDRNLGLNYIRDLLKNVNLIELKEKIFKLDDSILKERLLEGITYMIDNNINPEWLVMDDLIVIHPSLRPLLYSKKTNTQFKESFEYLEYKLDILNHLYLIVIYNNNRLSIMEDQKAPFFIINQQRIKLHKMINNLFSYLYFYQNRSYEENVKCINWALKHKDTFFENS